MNKGNIYIFQRFQLIMTEYMSVLASNVNLHLPSQVYNFYESQIGHVIKVMTIPGKVV